ncbi:hypothetical protein SCHPADRAFT_948229 [Schizopora paradoxa]|uniref:Uncharacterized protein n=1 Tax=Schizopora paradoxa TaxID=27342 RepID=A0A0H2RG11_9AGAM|nr:hypothetical protein SCHPADRAFT_948229 [Schizopora paradoxa]
MNQFLRLTRRPHFSQAQALKEDSGDIKSDNVSGRSTKSSSQGRDLASGHDEDSGVPPDIPLEPSTDVFNMEELKSKLDEFDAHDRGKDGDPNGPDPIIRAHGNLLFLDYKLQSILDRVMEEIKLLDSAVKDALPRQASQQIARLSASRNEVRSILVDVSGTDPLSDLTNINFKKAITERAKECISLVNKYVATDSKYEKPQNTQNIPANAIFFDCSLIPQETVRLMNPILLIPLIVVVALAAFYHVSHAGCNATLQSFKDNMKLSFELGGAELDVYKEGLLKALPTDLRTVKKRFGVEAETVTYAVCPGCEKIFPPEMKKGVAHYPFRCETFHPTDRRFRYL